MDHKRRYGSRGSGQYNQSPKQLDSVTFVELLEQDSKPTFVVDVSRVFESSAAIEVRYCNPALRNIPNLHAMILGNALRNLDGNLSIFGTWVVGQGFRADEFLNSPEAPFQGMLWTAITLRQRFRVVSAGPDIDRHVSSTGQESLLFGIDAAPSNPREDDEDNFSTSSTEKQAYGCTDLSAPSNRFSKHVRFFRDVDWSSTILGHIDDWPLQLHQMCNFLMSDPTPAFLLWGADLVVIYNEAAIEVLLERHPQAMGHPLQSIYPEVWDQISVLIQKVQKSGKPIRVEEVPMLLKRQGRMDECFFSFQYQPITNERGTVLGIYEPFTDVTKQMQSERRLSTLLEVSKCSFAQDLKSCWKQLLQALDSTKALPFAILYSTEEAWSEASSNSTNSHSSQVTCILEGKLGIPEEHMAAPARLNLEHESDGYAAAFRQAIKTGDTVILQRVDGTLPEAFVSGLQLRGFRESSSVVVIFPIRPTGGASVVGLLVLGISPHLAIDTEFYKFTDILNRQIATSVAAVLLLEEEKRRRQQVAQQLDLKTQELMVSESKFQRLADTSPVGIVVADPQGDILYANQAFYDITGHPGNDRGRESWLQLFRDDTQASLMEQWIHLHQTRKPITIELPLLKPWTKTIPNGETLQGPSWILLSAFVEEFADGSISGSRATVTDISQQKWAEEHQKRRMEEAMELKRQQEAFIDMTSHEIRNPLSAIIQSADSIVMSLATARSAAVAVGSAMPISKDLVDDSVDAAETITLCAQHQKRVIDDVLTLSKLDSDMLIVTPVDVEPLQIVQHVLRMFESEAKKHQIDIQLQVEETFYSFDSTHVRLDPSRLTQVLVNVLGNAIKFTQLSAERKIIVRVGASLQSPLETDQEVEYITPQKMSNEVLFVDTPGVGENVYLRVAVQDTGPGLKPVEKQMLFKRFGQASPRTHVEYGGSGLGLFISKKLSELQGGAVGFSSEHGSGSTFAFYVRARRSLPSRQSSNISAEEVAQSIGKIALPDHRSTEILSNPRASPPVLAEARIGSLNAQVQPQLVILVVEDNLVNQRVLCKQLRNLGHVVYAANHGGEAIDFLKKTTYWQGVEEGLVLDIILLDTEMPVMDGLTCARMIRQMQQNGQICRHIPIISVTANARSEQIETATAAGMDDTISKPFRVADLTPKMEDLIRKYGDGV